MDKCAPCGADKADRIISVHDGGGLTQGLLFTGEAWLQRS
jgi:hypothetical protein